MRPKNLEKEKAIRKLALQIIAEEGLENLSMQKLARAAGVSPRTLYIKYADKEDMLLTLFIEEVLTVYEAAVLQNFREDMELREGLECIWNNMWGFLRANHTAFILMQYGKSSPLLNKAYTERNIREGQFFAPLHRFMTLQMESGHIEPLPFAVYRALLFAPLLEMTAEYFECLDRPFQPVTDETLQKALDILIKGIQKQ